MEEGKHFMKIWEQRANENVKNHILNNNIMVKNMERLFDYFKNKNGSRAPKGYDDYIRS